jgi:hypothetical protein
MGTAQGPRMATVPRALSRTDVGEPRVRGAGWGAGLDASADVAPACGAALSGRGTLVVAAALSGRAGAGTEVDALTGGAGASFSRVQAVTRPSASMETPMDVRIIRLVEGWGVSG